MQVTGNTIFNVIQMGDLDVDSNDRPLDPPMILKTEVLSNFFTDIVRHDQRRCGSSIMFIVPRAGPPITGSLLLSSGFPVGRSMLRFSPELLSPLTSRTPCELLGAQINCCEPQSRSRGSCCRRSKKGESAEGQGRQKFRNALVWR